MSRERQQRTSRRSSGSGPAGRRSFVERVRFASRSVRAHWQVPLTLGVFVASAWITVGQCDYAALRWTLSTLAQCAAALLGLVLVAAVFFRGRAAEADGRLKELQHVYEQQLAVGGGASDQKREPVPDMWYAWQELEGSYRQLIAGQSMRDMYMAATCVALHVMKATQHRRYPGELDKFLGVETYLSQEDAEAVWSAHKACADPFTFFQYLMVSAILLSGGVLVACAQAGGPVTQEHLQASRALHEHCARDRISSLVNTARVGRFMGWLPRAFVSLAASLLVSLLALPLCVEGKTTIVLAAWACALSTAAAIAGAAFLVRPVRYLAAKRSDPLQAIGFRRWR